MNFEGLHSNVDNFFKENLINFKLSHQVQKEIIYSFCGGKKIRSKLFFSSLDDIIITNNLNPDLDKDSLMCLSAAIECIHSYSLIHDDLPCMDNDFYRRGKLSTHKMFGIANAVLVGDGLQSLAFEFLANSKYLNNKILMGLSKASGFSGMVGGQIMDLSDNEDFFTIHLLKTGELFGACTYLAANVFPEIYETKLFEGYKEFGRYLGILFQIKDDQLDNENIDSKDLNIKSICDKLYNGSFSEAFTKKWINIVLNRST